MKKILFSLFIAASFLFFKPDFCSAFSFLGDYDNEYVTPYKKSSINFITENDYFVDSLVDRYYTSGLRLGWTSPEMDFTGSDADNHPYLAKIAKIGLARGHRVSKFNLHLNQEIYTPEDRKENYKEGDRPYAGFLYLSLGLTNRNSVAEERIWLDAGIVGKESLARQTQEFAHKFGYNVPKWHGWKHQLGTEPVLNLHYQFTRKFTMITTDAFSSDILFTLDAALGNADIHAGSSARLRIGHNLGADFGVPNINMSYNASSAHSDDLSLYIFAGTGGRLSAWNQFLKGNAFGSKTDVKVIPYIFDYEFGAAVLYNGWRVSYIYTFKSKEFKAQSSGMEVGALLLEIAF